MCDQCALGIGPLPSRCYLCHKITRQHAVCNVCRHKSSLSHVWVATAYEGLGKELVYKLKFGRARSVADPVGRIMSNQLPRLDKSVIVTHVPTANQRVRVRGYDQARLIAKAVADQKGWLYVPLLVRLGSKRQVGASKTERESQLRDAFAPRNKKLIKNAHVLLIDDVVTTGATIEFAGRALKDAGAKTVDVAVFAAS